ncbi:protein-L-isoaspartate(D-aspartate) O-methyltransferase [bacterium]
MSTRRYSMVKNQLMLRGIKDKKVLEVMRKVPRHEFVPKLYKEYAYEDRPVPIGQGQTISQPYIVALMTELLELNKKSKVLEVGTGSGYQAAVLAELANEVYTIEIVKELYINSTKVLKQLGYKNVHVKFGDGYLGWPEFAPFDAVIVTCAPDHIPEPLVEQLKIGGYICIPVGEEFSVQELVLAKKVGKNKLEKKYITAVRFVPLVRGK